MGFYYYFLFWGIFEIFHNNKTQVLQIHTHTDTKLVCSIHLPRTKTNNDT